MCLEVKHNDTMCLESRIRKVNVRDVSGKVSGVVKTVFC
jgi:hypothetical protein